MALAEPVQGQVVRYSYLWHREALRGQEEGSKDRPCAVILTVRTVSDRLEVTVLPITHALPAGDIEGIEIPASTKQRLGLDADRSWIVVSEANRFEWPGPDIRPIVGSTASTYGHLPPALFRQVREAFIAAARRQRLSVSRRTE